MASPRSSTGNFWTGIIVQPQDVLAMLTRANLAVSGPSLGIYMRTGADAYLRQRAQERFRKEGDYAVGGQWAPLAQSTVEIRENLNYPGAHPINRRTGELENFITRSSGDVTVAGDTAVLTMPGSEPTGELGEKFRTAQVGRNRPPRTRKRPVLGLDQLDLQMVMEGMDQYLVTMISGGTP